MYGNPPIFLPPVSNREDLLLSISIFDDDTGQPVNLSGCVTASGLPFTASFWTVTSGSVGANYLNSITIPVPPIGNELEAFTLVGIVGAFVAGQPVKIVDISGNNYMLGLITSYTASTQTMVIQIGSTFQFEIRRGAPRNDGTGYVPWYDFGTPDELGLLISAALGTGITITDIGYLQILIPESTFRRLHLGTFTAAMTMFDGTNTRQVFIGKLPVLYGSVTQ